MNPSGPWFQTFTGRTIHLDQPPSTWPITLTDIAHSLSLTCRWGGHVRDFYSVAQHCLIVANALEPYGPEMMLNGLLHDAAEAYTGDMIGPLKRLLRSKEKTSHRSSYDEFELAVHRAVAQTFGLDQDFHHHHAVVRADLSALATENRDLCFESIEHKCWANEVLPPPLSFRISPMKSSEVEKEFRITFMKLYSLIHPDETPPVEKEP